MTVNADDYWADHPNAMEALTRCPPEATIELLDLLDKGQTPTLGWWRKRMRGHH